jgi:hypothetical protein
MEQAVGLAMEQAVGLAMEQAGGQAVVEGQAGGRLRHGGGTAGSVFSSV